MQKDKNNRKWFVFTLIVKRRPFSTAEDNKIAHECFNRFFGILVLLNLLFHHRPMFSSIDLRNKHNFHHLKTYRIFIEFRKELIRLRSITSELIILIHAKNEKHQLRLVVMAVRREKRVTVTQQLSMKSSKLLLISTCTTKKFVSEKREMMNWEI